MIEVEIQKLTAAIEALVEVLGSAKVGNLLPTKKETLTIPNNSQQLPTETDAKDDAAREKMQAERLAKLDKIEREQAEHAKTMDEVYGKTLAEKKLAEDAALAAVYKAEQAKAKRKAAKVTREEVEALVEASTEENPKSPQPEKIAANITAEDLKTVAMEIARADSSARPLILSILSLHGAKTITQLDPKHYQEVHAELMSIAYDIAKNGEVTQ